MKSWLANVMVIPNGRSVILHSVSARFPFDLVSLGLTDSGRFLPRSFCCLWLRTVFCLVDHDIHLPSFNTILIPFLFAEKLLSSSWPDASPLLAGRGILSFNILLREAYGPTD